MSGHHTIAETEKAVQAKLGAVPLHREQMAAVSNIHRAATAIRQHLENSVLRTSDLTWTGFVVLWVVWIWGEMETRYVAEEAGISKGTLTGVAKTRTLSLDVGALNNELVLENDVVFGSVNANRRHFEAATEALARADRDWLEALITRTVPLDRWQEALDKGDDDVKAVIDFDG